MAKQITGIEIGNFRVKIAQCGEDGVRRTAIEELPDKLVREGAIISWESMSDVLKEMMKKYQITCRDVALVLPDAVTYMNRLRMPIMTVDQLKVNLPYEFHDYITDDMTKYNFDYAVIAKEENPETHAPESMDLLAAAVRKETIEQYRTMFRRAGMRLVSAAPEVMAYQNIINRYMQAHAIEDPEDYAILDLGHTTIQMHIFTRGYYEVSRSIEPGLVSMTQLIAEINDSDEHIAEIVKQNNQDNIWAHESCQAFYNRIAIEVMRVINFYGFNHPDNRLNKIFYCGGGSKLTPLIEEIKETIETKMIGIDALFTENYQDELLGELPAAIGITQG